MPHLLGCGALVQYTCKQICVMLVGNHKPAILHHVYKDPGASQQAGPFQELFRWLQTSLAGMLVKPELIWMLQV